MEWQKHLIEYFTKTDLSVYIIISMGVACFYNSLMISDPYQNFLNWLERKKVNETLITLVTCPMCVSFWTVLITTFNPLMAGMSFIGAKIINDYLWKK